MVTWLTQLQHIPEKSVVVVGILDVTYDDFKRPVYEPQIDGSKAGRELPGIFDQVIPLGLFTVEEGGAATLDLATGKHRGSVCHPNNVFGVPAKDRTGLLGLLEPPDPGQPLKTRAAGTPKHLNPLTTNP